MNLEETLQQHEKQVDDLLKAANKYVGALKSWKKACQVGHLGNREKAAGQAQDLADGLSAPLTDAASSWDFDARAYLEGEDWRRELQATAAEREDMRILEENEYLISSPVVVRSQPGRGSLLIGKENVPEIRPRLVASRLKKLRDRAGSANSQEFVEGLYGAYAHLKKEADIYVKFRDIYELFCLTPGWKKENPQAAFAQSIYALNLSPVRSTRAGRMFEFITPSANARERDVFTAYSEDGRPLRYLGIRFGEPNKS